jgi:hypothetical protein
MDKNGSGWDFVLIPNPSSTYIKIESIVMSSLRQEMRAQIP